MYKHILVPLDGSHAAEQALPHAIKLAHAFESTITIVSVKNRPNIISDDWSNNSRTFILNLHNTDKLVLTAYLNAWRADLEELNIRSNAIVIEHKDPAFGLEKIVNTNQFDAVVMTTHGRVGMKRWVIGSVAEHLLRTSNIPIMLVRIDDAMSKFNPTQLHKYQEPKHV